MARILILKSRGELYQIEMFNLIFKSTLNFKTYYTSYKAI